ncbi:MAG TPA: molybdate ABC transporter substrate-binding protein [Solirubrobacteraceae bacterium]|nr:molybdate ABC transporter substrate-binding protein [Solirubrobacteraceae bacterium]
MRRAALAAALALLAAGGCGGGGDEGPLTVSAAASMRDALRLCAPDDVRLQLAGSDELAAQIRKGVRPDVYAAADTALPEALAREGLLEPPVVFATNRLVLATRGDSDILRWEEITEPGVEIAIGSESVPVGRYTREVLARLGPENARAILANVRTEEPDVTGIVGKLVQGAVEAGFVYRSDVTNSGGRFGEIPLPGRAQPDVAYAAGVVRGTELPDEAAAFVEDLRTGRCARELRAAGFGRAP